MGARLIIKGTIKGTSTEYLRGATYLYHREGTFQELIQEKVSEEWVDFFLSKEVIVM